MPCYTISAVRLELRNANFDLLKLALESLGYKNIQISANILSFGNGSYYDRNSGALALRGIGEKEGNKIRQAYSAELVKKNAQRYGWQLKQISNYRYEIQKR